MTISVPFVLHITLGNLPDSVDPQKFDDFDQAFDNLVSDLSDFTGFAGDLSGLFRYAAGNPLCVAFVVILLVVMAFRICPLIFRSFRR